MTPQQAETGSHRPRLRLTIAEARALIAPTPKVPIDDLITSAPSGDGHAVLVLPALARGDQYTARVRTFLTRIGYAAHGWNLGVNVGPTQRLLDGAAERLTELSDAYGPVSIVGYSLGGLFARWLSLRMPDRVRQVITICSPIRDATRNFWLPLAPFLRLWRGPDLQGLADDVARPLPVPCTVLFSRDDGVVNWSACLDPTCPEDCVEIAGPHVLIAANRQVMAILAKELARPSFHRPDDCLAAPAMTGLAATPNHHDHPARLS